MSEASVGDAAPSSLADSSAPPARQCSHGAATAMSGSSRSYSLLTTA
jgi:hypothetical protein